jgi:hypothetical protein
MDRPRDMGTSQRVSFSPLGVSDVHLGRMARPLAALASGLAAFLVTAWIWAQPAERVPPDFTLIWNAASVWLAGGDPYLSVRHVIFPLFYPPTAVILGVPFTVLPVYWATAIFVGIGAGAFAYAVWPSYRHALLGLASGAGIMTITVAQWSPLLIAAALLPPLGWLLAAKPTVAAALWIAYPSWRSLLFAAIFTSICLVVWPEGFWSWLTVTREAAHFTPLILYPWGGPLLLLALKYWRTPEGRLLLALACAPRTPFLYDALPLFLIPKTGKEALILWAGTMIAWPFQFWAVGLYWNDRVFVSAYTELWCVFLLCLAMLWRRSRS